jgi:hypothetical protein
MNNEKKELINWLNTEVKSNTIILDYILDIKDKLLFKFECEGLSLRNGEDIFLINLIYYLYTNSYLN